MHCPSCRAQLSESDPVCPHCQFSLEQLDDVFTSEKTLTDPISDPGRLLRRGEVAAIKQAFRALQNRFPQIKVSALIQPCPEASLAQPNAYLFWIFNRGELSGPMEKGGKNHRLLFWIDPKSHVVRVTLGYGLEPWLSTERLKKTLQAADIPARRGAWATAIQNFSVELSVQLAELSRSLPQAFGIAASSEWIDTETPDLDHALERSTTAPVY